MPKFNSSRWSLRIITFPTIILEMTYQVVLNTNNIIVSYTWKFNNKMLSYNIGKKCKHDGRSTYFYVTSCHSTSDKNRCNVFQCESICYTILCCRYIMPLIFVITLLSNIMIILILSKRHMLSPTNLVLKAMAISDLLTVIFPFPW